jgi:hypothetical protein
MVAAAVLKVGQVVMTCPPFLYPEEMKTYTSPMSIVLNTAANIPPAAILSRWWQFNAAFCHFEVSL